MDNQLTHFILIALLLLCVVTVAVPQQQFSTELVSFPSEGASGQLFIHGTLYKPVKSLSNSVIVLMHGSGASNRDEIADITYWNTDAKPYPLNPSCGVQPVYIPFFKQLAEYLASIGFAVLAYDKRGCCSMDLYKDYCSQCQIDPLGHYTDSCYYACSPTDEPQKYNLNKLSVYDEALDATNAMIFLQKQYQFENIIVMGHSQGVNLAPIAVNQYLNSSNTLNVTHVVLLAGSLTPFDELLVDQFQRVYNRAKQLETACINDPSAPYSKELIENMKSIEKSMEELKPVAIEFFKKLKAGEYPLDHVYRLGFAITGTYLMSSINTSTPEYFQKQILTYKLSHTKVMSINSPTDLNVNENDYKPLLSILKMRSEILPTVETQAHVIPYLTHFMTNASLVSKTPLITSDVKQVLYEFLAK
jgi:predicted esterase